MSNKPTDNNPPKTTPNTMAITFNQVTLVGYLGQDPRAVTTKSGTPMAALRLSTPKPTAAQPAQPAMSGAPAPRPESDWHDITLFGQAATTALNYARKGSLLLIQGRLTYRQYTAADGTPRTAASVDGHTIQLLDRKETAAPATAAPAPMPAAPANYGQQPAPRTTPAPLPGEDILPF